MNTSNCSHRDILVAGSVRYTVRKGLVALALICCVSASKPSAAQPLDTLVAQISNYYQDLRQYQFNGSTEVRIRRGRQTQTSSYDFTIAEQFPTHIRIDIGGEQARLLVSNGDTTWAYHPSTESYIQRPGILTPGSQRSDFPDLLSTYKQLSNLMDTARLVDPDTSYVLDDSLHGAFIIEISPKPTPQTRSESTTIQLWIRDSDLVVLKERTTRFIPDSPYGPVSITQTTQMKSAHVQDSIPEGTFLFIPPSDAEQVTQIDAFSNIPITLHGREAEDFSLRLLNSENELALHDLKGKVVVMNFWATWCAPCRAEMNALERLERQYRQDGLVVLAINEEEIPDIVQEYIDDERLDLTVLLDRFGLVGRQYEVYELPTTFIIDRERIIRDHLIGARTEEDFRLAIEKVLQ